MARSRGKIVVLVAALAAAAGWALAQRARSFAAGEGRLSDGSERHVALDAPGLRHVVWDTPAPAGGASASAGGEERPALSPDGRWLVFASGARGLNCELYLCELAGRTPGEPRRIAELDGPNDELAPCFAGEYLYFASDRAGGAGGLDLYRAHVRDGHFDAPERLDDAAERGRRQRTRARARERRARLRQHARRRLAPVAGHARRSGRAARRAAAPGRARRRRGAARAGLRARRARAFLRRAARRSLRPRRERPRARRLAGAARARAARHRRRAPRAVPGCGRLRAVVRRRAGRRAAAPRACPLARARARARAALERVRHGRGRLAARARAGGAARAALERAEPRLQVHPGLGDRAPRAALPAALRDPRRRRGRERRRRRARGADATRLPDAADRARGLARRTRARRRARERLGRR